MTAASLEAVGRQFESEGFAVVDDFFTPEECDDMAALAEAAPFEMGVGDEADGKLSYKPMQHLVDPAIQRWAADPRWAGLVHQLVGPDARLYWEQFVGKPPHAGTLVPWHQDNGYAPVEPPQYLTCWLALEDATVDNGCIWVLPGSHRDGYERHTNDGGFFMVGYDGPDEGIPVPLSRGSVLLFSSLMQHRSGPNTTATNRRAWILQYCPAHAAHGTTGTPFDDRLLVSRDGEWLEEPIRERRFDPSALA